MRYEMDDLAIHAGQKGDISFYLGLILLFS